MIFYTNMEGCLYKSNIDSNYYLVNSVASYSVIATEFESFNSKFISIDLLNNFDEIAFCASNVKNILDNYIEFKDNIVYTWLDEYNEITYKSKVFILKNWTNLYNFVAGRI